MEMVRAMALCREVALGPACLWRFFPPRPTAGARGTPLNQGRLTREGKRKRGVSLGQNKTRRRDRTGTKPKTRHTKGTHRDQKQRQSRILRHVLPRPGRGKMPNSASPRNKDQISNKQSRGRGACATRPPRFEVPESQGLRCGAA